MKIIKIRQDEGKILLVDDAHDLAAFELMAHGPDTIGREVDCIASPGIARFYLERMKRTYEAVLCEPLSVRYDAQAQEQMHELLSSAAARNMLRVCYSCGKKREIYGLGFTAEEFDGFVPKSHGIRGVENVLDRVSVDVFSRD